MSPQPGTVTGSIGVLTGKPVLGAALSRVGVTSDLVTQGEHAAMFSPQHPFSSDEWALVNDWLDHIYADFTGKVAEGRGMTQPQVHELARGRVWTGADALERGLVDELGGIERAATIARKRAGLPGSAELRVYPRSRPLDRLRPASSSQSADGRRRQPARRHLGSGRPSSRRARGWAARAADVARLLDL